MLDRTSKSKKRFIFSLLLSPPQCTVGLSLEGTSMLIEFDDAYRAMLPYFDRLWEVVNGSWDDWNKEISAKVLALASSRSRAALVNDFMRSRGARLALEDGTVAVVIRQQMQVLVFAPDGFDGCIGVRLKKLDEDGLSRNQPTKQVREFRDQRTLPGIQADYHLEAGYVLDRFGSGLASIDLVCPSGDGIYWKAEIVPNGGLNQNVANLFPEHPPGGEPQTVRVRKKDEKKSGDTDETSGAG
jgi:hypothetical protein